MIKRELVKELGLFPVIGGRYLQRMDMEVTPFDFYSEHSSDST